MSGPPCRKSIPMSPQSALRDFPGKKPSMCSVVVPGAMSYSTISVFLCWNVRSKGEPPVHLSGLL